MVVHNLYLLDKNGISLVDLTVGSLKIDANLASGFFVAILSFIKELLKSDKEVITDMGMQNLRLYFVYSPPIIGVVAVDPEDDRSEITSVVKYILNEFKSKYDLANWDHDVYPFREFDEYMREKIQKVYDQLKYKIFYEAFKIYTKYRKYGINYEWDEKINKLLQKLGPQFMCLTGTYFEYMGSKIMGADIMRFSNLEPDFDSETELLISNTSLNIWNKDLFELMNKIFEYLQNLDEYFAEKYEDKSIIISQ